MNAPSASLRAGSASRLGFASTLHHFARDAVLTHTLKSCYFHVAAAARLGSRALSKRFSPESNFLYNRPTGSYRDSVPVGCVPVPDVEKRFRTWSRTRSEISSTLSRTEL